MNSDSKPSTKRHICMVVQNDVVHDSRVKREALTLSNNGYRVTIIGVKSFPEQRSIENLNGITIKRISPKIKNKTLRKLYKVFLFSTQDNRRLKDMLYNEHADIYHAHDLDTLKPAYKASMLHSVKLVYDSHELYTEMLKRGNFKSIYSMLVKIYFFFYRLYYSFIEKRYIHLVEKVITVSVSIAHELQRCYNVKLPIVIRNVPLNNTVIYQFNLQKKFNLPEGSVIIFYQGKFKENRGILELIQAIALLPEKYILFLLGSGPLEKQIRKECISQQIRDRVIIKDQVTSEQLLSYTRNADIGIVFLERTNLNQQYALPNKLFEFMSVGIPVLGSNLPEIRNIITKEVIGKICEGLNPVNIASAIESLYNDPMYQMYSKNAIKAYTREYNWEKESKKLIAVYELFHD